ncbi:unnamed protein product [Candida verbasci]|uniref:Condensin complex subunit 1 n=1 Tax=Candida verbasci TaxID=1227364 RepID=A0A9W4TTG9_9ASCO|nr:unnamed protein product [Candida verbasci]
MEFNLTTYFNAFDVDKDYELNFSDLNNKLESITELLANNPESVNHNEELMEDLIELSHGYTHLNEKQQKQLTYLITSSFSAVGQQILNQINNEEFLEHINYYKDILEKYGYLTFVVLKYISKEDFSVIGNAKSQKSIPRETLAKWKSNCAEVEYFLTCILVILKIDLSKIFVTNSERNAYLELFSRPVINLMESPERMKIQGIKLMIFELLCVLVTKHGHGKMIQHSIIQCLTYYAHLPQYMAALLHKMSEEYQHTSLTEEVLREIAQTQFSANDNNGPKAISEFLIKLSERSPKLVLKQMIGIQQLLDNSNQALRCSVVETCGNIVVDILRNGQNSSENEEVHNYEHQVGVLLDLLEQRFLDQNPFVRSRAIQALTKVAELDIKLTQRRQKFLLLAVKFLNDRSMYVRRNAIKLIIKLIMKHQFQSVHGSQLDLEPWKIRLEEAEKELLQYLPKNTTDGQEEEDKEEEDKEEEDKEDKEEIEEKEDKEEEEDKEVSDDQAEVKDDDDMDVDEEDKDLDEEDSKSDELNEDVDMNKDDNNEQNNDNDSNDNDANIPNESNLPDRTVLARAQLKAKYYRDAVNFIEAIMEGTEIVSKLLFSKNRNEAIESMDFLVLADAYGINNASQGIRKMLHLVWTKGSTDEGKSVASHLIDCYRSLYLTTPDSASRLDKATHIAKNLISLTFDASLADLASLEKLLGLMYEGNYIHSEVINVLWQIYSLNITDKSDEVKQELMRQKRGAIIILGMFALEDHYISLNNIDALLKIGLGEIGKSDLILCSYTCIALQRIKNKKNPETKIRQEIQVMDKIKEILVEYNEQPEYYLVAEQAISAIFQSSSNPEEVCSKIIKEKTMLVFNGDSDSQSDALSQLLFLVGHVAIKMIVYLEQLENQFKKKKNSADSANPGENQDKDTTQENELEMIGGTTEDDFTDAVVHVKEKELLYGENSLLARFGPLVKEVILQKNFNIKLQRSAVLCMVKLMCISSIYCEDNLPLLLKLLETHKDPIIRCNCVLGLGDMAVCFNNIVDENTDFIYRRLTDDSIMVQRTCLMTVTFLILAGQVKVKGQLSSMAKCLEHPDQGISDMCKLFFTELAAKDNAIYNGFIDIFSGLSNDDTLPKVEMKSIIKFLITFIDKEKHQKQLSDKLLIRLNKCQSKHEWDDVAYVLTTIPYTNENIAEALKGGYKIVESRE